MKQKLKILIAGAFGYGNLGDDLLRDTLTYLLKKKYKDQIELYTDRPYPCKELIEYCDLRIIGPGGLLYDGNSSHEEYFRQYMKQPYILIGIGLQFIEAIKEKGFVSDCIQFADLIIGREIKDLPVFEKYGKKDSIFIGGSLLFSYPYLTNISKPFIKNKPHVTLCLGGISNANFLSDHHFFINRDYWSKINTILSYNIESDKVLEWVREMVRFNRTTIDFYYDTPQNAYNVIANSDLLITEKYHAGIMGLKAGIKVVTLIEEPLYKLKCLFPSLNISEFVKNTGAYIESIPEIKEMNGIPLKELRRKGYDPLKFLDTYMKDKFNISC
jgi:hypothetical protein